MTANEEILRREITQMSINRTNWEITKTEWELDTVLLGLDKCLCGHSPIKELCILKNIHNQRKALVGNCCVKKFMGINTGNIFDSLKRVVLDNSKNFTVKVIMYAKDKSWINDWEYNFYSDILSKRRLTQKQLAKKISINEKILKWVLRHDSDTYTKTVSENKNQLVINQ